jgi:hypothetical protein
MTHLKDRLAEFFYGELPAAEMTAARQHLMDCTECRVQIDQFEKTHLALRSSPDEEPARHIIFGPTNRRSWLSIFDWRLATTASAFAALAIAVLVALSPSPAPLAVQVPAPAPVVVQAQTIDYDRIINEVRNEVRQSDRAWIAGELQKRDREIQRLQGELAYYESFQRNVIWKETMENGSSIQLLAQRTEPRN